MQLKIWSVCVGRTVYEFYSLCPAQQTVVLVGCLLPLLHVSVCLQLGKDLYGGLKGSADNSLVLRAVQIVVLIGCLFAAGGIVLYGASTSFTAAFLARFIPGDLHT